MAAFTPLVLLVLWLGIFPELAPDIMQASLDRLIAVMAEAGVAVPQPGQQRDCQQRPLAGSEAMNTLLGTLAAIPQATALALFAMAILLYGAIANRRATCEYSRRRAGVSDSRALVSARVWSGGGCPHRRLYALTVRMPGRCWICFAAAVSLPLGLPRQQSLQLEGFEQLPCSRY